MGPRITIGVAVVVIAGIVCPGVARAQRTPPELHLASLEWAVADSAVVVRGVVVDVAGDAGWNIVTLDVRETLKGAKVQRVKFAAYRFPQGDADLAQAKQSQREMLWLLNRHEAASGAAPDREKMLARHHIDLYAPFVDGRPGQPALPFIPLAPQQAKDDLEPPPFLTIDLRVLKTSDEIAKAIRTAIADTQDQKAVRRYAMTLPHAIVQRSGFNVRYRNTLFVPVDRRLEHVARQLVQSPGDFVTQDDTDPNRHLRLEGVKALRLFPSTENLAVLRAWLDNPASTGRFKHTQSADLVPPIPKQVNPVRLALPAKLAEVPEIHFQQPLTKTMNTEHAQLHTAVTIDSVEFLNRQKTDAFIATLRNKRPDLAGLPFAMGDACRLKPEAGRQFALALEALRKTEGLAVGLDGTNASPRLKSYRQQATAVPPTASVAALTQVLGPEDAQAHLGLATYLADVVHADATRALAKLAIFSEEPAVRTEALTALKKRDRKDYTAILLAGLQYPWPAVAERSSEAIAALERKDLVPQLIETLDKPDPRAPQTQSRGDKQVSVVRELVRLNHHHNCLLCHAPAPRAGENPPPEALTAQIPVPSESMVAYYRPSNPDILVRFDVTYLRQDFSMKLPVADAEPWPALQRYDFLVRTREVTAAEARALEKLLQAEHPDGISPYQRAAVTALRALTGKDAGPTAAAWRKK